MTKKIIDTNSAPAAAGPYSQAVKANGLVFVSGQLPINPDTGGMPGSVAEQTAQSLANIKAILGAEGLDMNDIVKCMVFAQIKITSAPAFSSPSPAFAIISSNKSQRPSSCNL